MPEDEVPPWRAGIDADRRKRRRPRDERATLRRMTAGAVVTAAGLNALLFAQTAMQWEGPGGAQSAIVSLLGAWLPGSAPRPPGTSPSPAPPGVLPVTTTHPS